MTAMNIRELDGTTRHHGANEMPVSDDTPSEAQIFGPLSIYNYQQKSKRLARDLSGAFFGNVDVLKVLLVLRDGCTEDADDSAPSATPFTRFYHPSFLMRTHFMTSQTANHKHAGMFAGSMKMPVCKWITTFCDTGRSNSLIAGTEADWRTLVAYADGEAAWRAWENPQTADMAFENIVSTFSRLNYAGLTPSKLDEYLPSPDVFKNGNRYPVFFIDESDANPADPWIKMESADIYLGQQSCIRIFREDGKENDADDRRKLFLKQTVFFASDRQPDSAKVVARLFSGFLDPFFRGQDHIDGEVRSGSSSEVGSFRGLALPLFDRWEFNGPLGAFVGWVFLFCDKQEDCKAIFRRLISGRCSRPKLPDDCPTDRDVCREILRANLNDYAESLAEYILDEEIRRYDPARSEPAKYFSRIFHHVEGWKVKNMGRTPLAEEQHVQHENVADGDKCLSFLHVRLDNRVCVTLQQKEDTILPTLRHGPSEREYYERVAHWASGFWGDLSQIHTQYLRGRTRVSHSIPYTITIHLNKLKELHDAVQTLLAVPFPLTTPDQIPAAVRYFRYPVELYSLAIENALLYPLDQEDFRRWVPVIDWIDDAVDRDGLTPSFVTQLADKIARPLARISLQRSNVMRQPDAPLQVSGAIPRASLDFSTPFEGRILIAALIELLREAIHHCRGETPAVTVELIAGASPLVTVANTCTATEVPTLIVSGNQSAILDRFQSCLPRWLITPADCSNGVWLRTIRKKT